MTTVLHRRDKFVTFTLNVKKSHRQLIPVLALFLEMDSWFQGI